MLFLKKKNEKKKQKERTFQLDILIKYITHIIIIDIFLGLFIVSSFVYKCHV